MVAVMSTDDTAAERRRRQKIKRRDAGWDFVQTWVPTRAQGDALRRQAADMRKAAGDDLADEAGDVDGAVAHE